MIADNRLGSLFENFKLLKKEKHVFSLFRSHRWKIPFRMEGKMKGNNQLLENSDSHWRNVYF